MYYTYIITNKPRGVLYIGVTNNLERRMHEHKHELIPGFSKKYRLKTLVYYDASEDVSSAISREKQLKNWHREWKVNLIEEKNPTWRDITEDFEDFDCSTLDPEINSG